MIPDWLLGFVSAFPIVWLARRLGRLLLAVLVPRLVLLTLVIAYRCSIK